jgi:hypothetical protein
MLPGDDREDGDEGLGHQARCRHRSAYQGRQGQERNNAGNEQQRDRQHPTHSDKMSDSLIVRRASSWRSDPGEESPGAVPKVQHSGGTWRPVLLSVRLPVFACAQCEHVARECLMVSRLSCTSANSCPAYRGRDGARGYPRPGCRCQRPVRPRAPGLALRRVL